MDFIHLKDFDNSLLAMRKAGGEKKRKADKVLSALGMLQIGAKALQGFPTTNHGETRIRNCVKYELGGGYRLVTVQTGKVIALCFLATHDETDRWLDSNSGLTISKGTNGAWEPIYKSPSPDEPIRREPAPSSDKLVDRLDPSYFDRLFESVPPLVVIKLAALGSLVTYDQIEGTCSQIPSPERRSLIYDVLCLLASGNRQAAVSRLDLECGDATAIDELSEGEILEVRDGDQIRRLRVGSQEHGRWLAWFERTAGPMEWLLFLHPEQDAVVNADFNGPAQLSGVSGSGKTCVAIHRAIRLADREPKPRVLIVTLNRSLAGLIQRLVDAAAPDERVRRAISVSSFFQLCQSFLERFEPESRKLYGEITWKLNEHIDEVFREYYRCWLNNDAAVSLLPVHQSLISQGLDAETYTREEFDWIRSALPASMRDRYLLLDRHGRRIPLQVDARGKMIDGLSAWEAKMRDVGVIDYLGLTTALSRYVSKIRPCYEHVIIDEAQDFGTSELQILRALCLEGQNDIFLCGDIAQHVLPKHRSLGDAGISTSGRTRRIVRNYRNSREILKAAYEVLVDNLDESLLDDSDLEILDPQYASRSSNEPVVLEASSLEEEIGYARTMVADHLAASPGHRCCIAFAGYTIREVEQFGLKLGVPTLRGEQDPMDAGLVVSDLEQTKGYEFHIVVILNCRKGVLPPEGTAPEEAFRHGCRLYVAMTRARDELYLSYSGEVTDWLRRGSQALSFMRWDDVVKLNRSLVVNKPEALHQVEAGLPSGLRLRGRDFLYTPEGRGLSLDAIRKIDELVDGTGLIRDRQRVRWRDMATLLEDLEKQPKARQLFGPVVAEEIRVRLSQVRDARLAE